MRRKDIFNLVLEVYLPINIIIDLKFRENRLSRDLAKDSAFLAKYFNKNCMRKGSRSKLSLQ